MERTHACQERLHRWGHANQVSFDANKESFQVVSRTDPEGQNFKLLEVTFDSQLSMADGARKLVQERN